MLLIYSTLFSDGIDALKSDIEVLNNEEFYNRAFSDDAFQNTVEFITSSIEKYGFDELSGKRAHKFIVKEGLSMGGNSLSMSVIVPRRGIPMDRIKPKIQTWSIEEDWRPLGFSSGGNISNAEIAFCGFGISTENYDDFKDIDIKGKIAIILTDSPEGVNSTKYQVESSLTYKVKNAQSKGAAAVFIVRTMGDSANVFTPFVVENTKMDIPALQVNRSTIERYFPKKVGLLDLEKLIYEKKSPQSVVLENTTCDLSLQIEEKEVLYQNIFGQVEGDDNSNSVLILIPYDEKLSDKKLEEYLKNEGKFFFESGNNISGIAAGLELARRFNENPTSKNVSLVFLANEEPNFNGSNELFNSNRALVTNSPLVIYLDNTDKVHKNNIEFMCKNPIFTTLIRETEGFKKLNVKSSDFPSIDFSRVAANNVNFARFSNKKRNYPPPKREWDDSDYEELSNYVDMIEEFIRKSVE